MSHSPNYDQYFETESLQSDLRGRSVRGGVTTLFGHTIGFLVHMISTMALARILTPAAFGLIAMVSFFVGFVMMFKDAGLSMATVQRHEINHRQVSTLFWVNVGISVLLMLVMIAVSPLIALFYERAEVIGITIGFSLGFPLSGAFVQHQAILRRQMRFKALAGIEIGARTGAVIVAIVTAMMGAGYWAIVFMRLSFDLFSLIAAWGLCRWRPGRPIWDREVLSLLGFGGNVAIFNFVNYFARHGDNLLVAKLMGATPAGLYSKAYDIFMLPTARINAPIASVAIPGLSRLQDQPERFRGFYLKALSALVMPTLPAAALFIVFAEEAIGIVLGPNFTGSVEIFRALSVAGLVQPIANTNGWLFMATNRTDRMVRYGLLSTSVFIACFLIGIYTGGALGLAIGFAAAMWLLAPICLFWSARSTCITMKDIAAAVSRPFAASLLAGAVGWLIRALLVQMKAGLLLTATIGGAAMGLAYLAILFYGFGAKDFYFSLIREFLPGARKQRINGNDESAGKPPV